MSQPAQFAGCICQAAVVSEFACLCHSQRGTPEDWAESERSITARDRLGVSGLEHAGNAVLPAAQEEAAQDTPAVGRSESVGPGYADGLHGTAVAGDAVVTSRSDDWADMPSAIFLI